jgi:hypothetical protein
MLVQPGKTDIQLADSGCIAFSNNAILSAGADGAAHESIGRFIDLVVDRLFKTCTCVAADDTKRPGRTAGNIFPLST